MCTTGASANSFPYSAARLDLEEGGDPSAALHQMFLCLLRRPSDSGLRVDLARLALDFQSPENTIKLLSAPDATYDNAGSEHEAMWLVVRAAQSLGQKDHAKHQLELILKDFPEDQRARQMLADLTRR